MRDRKNIRNARRRPSLGASAVCLSLILAACHRTSAEQLIRDTIAQMQQAGDKQDIDGVLAPLADDFAGRGDDEVNIDRKELKQFLTVLRMEQHGGLHATLGPITVALQGNDSATADFTMLLTGAKGLLAGDGQVEQVHTGWRLDGSHWKLVEAEWKASEAGK